MGKVAWRKNKPSPIIPEIPGRPLWTDEDLQKMGEQMQKLSKEMEDVLRTAKKAGAELADLVARARAEQRRGLGKQW